MKVSKFYFPLLAAGVLASCSSESEPVVDNGTNNGEAQYLAVNICAPSAATRAEDGGFENGTEAEDAVNKATFIVFEQSGAVKTVMSDVNLTPWQGLGNYNPNVENISQAVIVVDGVKKNEVTEYEILAVLNCNEIFTTSQTKDEILKIVNDYATTGVANSFVMSNSSYNDATATRLTSANFANNAELAKLNPVEIYVERVVAKATATKSEDFSITSTTKLLSGETAEMTFTPGVVGIEFANVANKSYLFKNIDNINYTDWNDGDNKRSYWANTPVSAEGFDYLNKSYNKIGEAGFPKTYTEYLQENTSATKTSVLVTAVLKDDEGNAVDLAYLAGQYTTPNGAATMIANFLKNQGYRILDENTLRTINYGVEDVDDDIEWVSVDEWEAPVKNDETLGYMSYMVPTDATAKYVKLTGGKNEDGSDKYVEVDINDVLTGDQYLTQYWNEGRCYYYLEIEHFLKQGEEFLLGVVRNHVYNLSLNGLAGLGTPVFNPDATIIPQKRTDDDNTYLAARINILKWKIVNQDVVFDM